MQAEVFGAFGFVIAVAMWWTYFDDIATVKVKAHWLATPSLGLPSSTDDSGHHSVRRGKQETSHPTSSSNPMPTKSPAADHRLRSAFFC